jgi:tetratricopeptide (TPR) repeat protein
MKRGSCFAVAGLALASWVARPAAATEDAADPCAASASVAAQQEAWSSFVAGRDLLYAERYAEAEPALLTAVRLDPSSPLAHYALGQVYMALKRYRDAVPEFAACREAFGCFADADAEKRLDREIRTLNSTIRGFERDGLIKDWIPHQEENREPLATKGERVRFRAQLEARVEELRSWKERIHKGAGAPPEVLVALGTAHFQSGSLAEAEQAYKTALQYDPGLGDAHYDLAVVYLATERLADAEREVQLAEKAGLTVAPRLKQELRRRKPEGSQ